MIYQEVRDIGKKRNISVNSVLKILCVSKSGYYSWKNRRPSKQSLKKEKIKCSIHQVYKESKQIYGAPKITASLQQNGVYVSEKTVGRYMREDGLKAIWVRSSIRTTIDPDFDVKLKNVLKREFNPDKPNAVWVTDITYIRTLKGFVYLTCVMDLFSRRIIGWHVSESLATEGVIQAVSKAKQTRKVTQPVVIHSDRGCQYVSAAYLAATPAAEFIRSYSKKGTPWDNACIESFHALIKREWLNRHVIQDFDHAHRLIFEYIEAFYNTVRLHGYNDMCSPYDFEQAYRI